ncbi:hypothetical protein PAXRUDRAFT_830997, partial [Paxillus rubicundulus Ve08.2h10]
MNLGRKYDMLLILECSNVAAKFDLDTGVRPALASYRQALSDRSRRPTDPSGKWAA